MWAEQSSRADPLLPDAAVELVWSGRGLFVRGADTRAHCVGVFPERTFVGVRFRPGAGAAVLGLRGTALADARVGISELWGRAEMERLESQLADAWRARDTAAILEDAVAARAHRRPDPIVQGVVAALQRRLEPVRIGSLADQLGLSERQLLRRCTDALGYGPKTLDRIFRFQRFRRLAHRYGDRSLAELAVAAGYSDQPHLTRECVQLGGATPAELRVSVPFKTAA